MTATPAPKSNSLSRTHMTEYVLPTHANALGNVFGGQILAWIDLCAAICSQRHAGTICVTAGIDDLSFDGPVKVGQVVRLEACITATFRTSMEVKVTVRGENPSSGETWPCVEAFLAFVAIDEAGKPTCVPPVVVDSGDGPALLADAKTRRAQRLARAKRT